MHLTHDAVPDLPADSPSNGLVPAPTGRQSIKLSRIVIFFERREDVISRAVRRGFSRHRADEVSHWLLPSKDIKHTVASLRDTASRSGVDIELLCTTQIVEGADRSIFEWARRGGLLFWNITDGCAFFSGSHLTSLALLINVPYFGCPPFAQALAQDKFKLFQLCTALGIAAPDSALVENGEIICTFTGRPKGPFFVKPNSLGNKIGLHDASLCSSLKTALQQATTINHELFDRAVVQEFIEGPEIRVTFINGHLQPNGFCFGYDLIDSNATSRSFIPFHKREKKYNSFRDFTASDVFPKSYRSSVVKKITHSISTIARHVRLKDYFTFDFRIDSSGSPRLIDFNPGAFLCGGDVENYALQKFQRPLPAVLFSAMDNCFQGRQCRLFSEVGSLFRL